MSKTYACAPVVFILCFASFAAVLPRATAQPVARAERVARLNALPAEDMFRGQYVAGELLVQFHPSGIVYDVEAPGRRPRFRCVEFSSAELIAPFHRRGVQGEREAAQRIVEESGLTVARFISRPVVPARNRRLPLLGSLALVRVPPERTLAESRRAGRRPAGTIRTRHQGR